MTHEEYDLIAWRLAISFNKPSRKIDHQSKFELHNIKARLQQFRRTKVSQHGDTFFQETETQRITQDQRGLHNEMFQNTHTDTLTCTQVTPPPQLKPHHHKNNQDDKFKCSISTELCLGSGFLQGYIAAAIMKSSILAIYLSYQALLQSLQQQTPSHVSS